MSKIKIEQPRLRAGIARNRLAVAIDVTTLAVFFGLSTPLSENFESEPKLDSLVIKRTPRRSLCYYFSLVS